MKALLLTKAQTETWGKIRNHVIGTPDCLQPSCFTPNKEYKAFNDAGENYCTWTPGLIYGGCFSTATLKVLERKGLIKVHFFGGADRDDIVEIMAPYEQDAEVMADLYRRQESLKD